MSYSARLMPARSEERFWEEEATRMKSTFALYSIRGAPANPIEKTGSSQGRDGPPPSERAAQSRFSAESFRPGCGQRCRGTHR